MKKAAKRDTESKLGQSPSGQQALQIRNALNPSGVSWLMSMDTTNVTQIMKVAKNIKDFKQVAEAYRNLYDSDLSTDLTNEMNAKESQQFFALANATFFKRYNPGESIKVIVPAISLYKHFVPSKANLVRREKAAYVTMGTKFQPVVIGNQKPINMVEITLKGVKYWVLEKELQPKK